MNPLRGGVAAHAGLITRRTEGSSGERNPYPVTVVGTSSQPRQDVAAPAPSSTSLCCSSPSGWEPPFAERVDDLVLGACVILLIVGLCVAGGAA